MNELCYRTAGELAEAIRSRRVSSSETVEAFLAQTALFNSSLNAIVTLDENGARRRALKADEATAEGETWGALHGVPVTFKDVFSTAGLRTTAGHGPLANYVPENDAAVVEQLRGAGAIVFGKTNLPELAMDTQCENSLFGSTKNPWNPERTAGGSSGGEAAAIAAGMSPLGVGSDIGGSLRIPAHYCGVFCLKPTEGRVPQSGHIPPLPGAMNWIRHFAVSGPMARSAADLRLCLKIIAGPDGRDLSVPPASLREIPARPLKEYRFAWTDDFGGLPVSADTRAALKKLADALIDAGCKVEKAVPCEFDFEQVWKTYGALMGIMAAAYLPFLPRAVLKLFGGIAARKDLITRSAAQNTTASIRQYFKLMEERDRLTRALEQFLSSYDAWLCPVTSSPAFPHRKKGKINFPIEVDNQKTPGHLGTIGYTCPFNLTGNPAAVMPLGLSDDGLPIGVQVVGRLWDEAALLNTTEALSRITGPFRRPPASP